MPAPKLPPSLAPLVVPTGVHRKWIKFVCFSAEKQGKSTFLSSMPPPLLAIDCGEGGLGMYLPKDDPNYQCISVQTPPEFAEAVKFALKNEKWFNSVAIDGFTTHWGDHMDWWQEELGVTEIKAGNWRKVKGPWKTHLRRLMRANFHVGYSSWIKDIAYETEKTAGETGALVIKPTAIPALEKNVGYTIDMIFQCGVKLNEANQPTSKHFVRLHGGRRPLSIPPEEFYIGKTWEFNAKKPKPVWDTVIAPFLTDWKNGAAEHLGIDHEEAARGLADINETADDTEVGRILRLIAGQTELEAYKNVWDTEIDPALRQLSKRRQTEIGVAHEKKKKELAR